MIILSELPLLHTYVYGLVPALTLAVALPDPSPKQDSFTTSIVAARPVSTSME